MIWNYGVLDISFSLPNLHINKNKDSGNKRNSSGNSSQKPYYRRFAPAIFIINRIIITIIKYIPNTQSDPIHI
jgi:hypothetical protein